MAVNYKKEQQALYIKDVTLFWASVLETKPTFSGDSNEYIANIIVSEDDAKALKKLKLNKELKEIGVDVDENLETYADYEGKFLFKAKCPEYTAKGKKLFIKVVDKDGNDIDENVGNGSQGHIKLFAWVSDKGAAKGKMNTRLNAVVVTDLIPYNDTSGGFDEELGVDLSQSKKKGEDSSFSQSTAFDDDDLPF